MTRTSGNHAHVWSDQKMPSFIIKSVRAEASVCEEGSEDRPVCQLEHDAEGISEAKRVLEIENPMPICICDHTRMISVRESSLEHREK